LGLRKVGTLVASLLSKALDLTGIDSCIPFNVSNLPFKIIAGDVLNTIFLEEILRDFDAVVSALPYYLNRSIAKMAHDYGIHYFDLTEDVETTAYIKSLADTASTQIGYFSRVYPL
jgi:saccharopine dehydrogenase-like NADP-dependent oxidoreductase